MFLLDAKMAGNLSRQKQYKGARNNIRAKALLEPKCEV